MGAKAQPGAALGQVLRLYNFSALYLSFVYELCKLYIVMMVSKIRKLKMEKKQNITIQTILLGIGDSHKFRNWITDC